LVATFIALPLLVSGIPKWWDVWVSPPPKLGSPWIAFTPDEFLARTLVWHVLVIVGCIGVHLVQNQFREEEVAVIEARPPVDVPEAEARVKEITALLVGSEKTKDGRYRMPSNPFLEITDKDGRPGVVNIYDLKDERSKLLERIRDHEEKAKLLQAKAKHPGDHVAKYALLGLWCSSLAWAYRTPNNKQFHSGQPIRAD
jgi:hypothetical protein